ncbi:alanine racemase [Anoxynatronum sibiricum]|uniref:Alanine racemase n=1 Tax=Anoxynatronum sibiricum TaxID=210623 RepID=A0ABU9VRQ6_9CLOT
MQPEQLHRPVWAEVYLDHLAHNLKQIRQHLSMGTPICGVIKANGYGHGAVMMARELERLGAAHLAVATLTEALELRNSGCEMPILILGYTPEDKAALVIRHRLKQTIYTLDQAKAFSQAAVAASQKVCLHLKIDTGMSRLGFQVNEQAANDIAELCQYPGIEVEGIFTHYAAADDADKSETLSQLAKYQWMMKALENRRCSIKMKHTANSAAIIDMPETHMDMVRAGIMIYGLYPSADVDHSRIKLKRLMALKTRVAHVKSIEPGTGVSYGLTYRPSDQAVIATLPVGYADGFARSLGGKAEVMIQGKKVPVVGRICMDQCMIDVTGLDVQRGDEVTLYAPTSDKGDTVDDVARKLGTINYEITCMVSRRVPRVYIRQGVAVAVWDPSLEMTVG